MWGRLRLIVRVFLCILVRFCARILSVSQMCDNIFLQVIEVVCPHAEIILGQTTSYFCYSFVYSVLDVVRQHRAPLILFIESNGPLYPAVTFATIF